MQIAQLWTDVAKNPHKHNLNYDAPSDTAQNIKTRYVKVFHEHHKTTLLFTERDWKIIECYVKLGDKDKAVQKLSISKNTLWTTLAHCRVKTGINDATKMVNFLRECKSIKLKNVRYFDGL